MTLDDMRRAERAATEGRWNVDTSCAQVYIEDPDTGKCVVIADCCHIDAPNDEKEQDANAIFLAKARDAVPKLLAFIAEWDAYADCPDNVNFQDMVKKRKALDQQ